MHSKLLQFEEESISAFFFLPSKPPFFCGPEFDEFFDDPFDFHDV